MQLRLTILSDATFGRGDGVAGLVDTEVEQDLTTGLPYLRGRTLKGLLVEECANLLYGLKRDHSNKPALGRLHRAAHFLFGMPGSNLNTEADLHIGSAQLPKRLRKAVAAEVQRKQFDPVEILDTLTGLRRQTAIDDATGTPLEGSLRTSRVVLRDLAFYAPLSFDQPPTHDALALLAACALAVRRAGTDRNRGRGRLHLHLYEPGEDKGHGSSQERRQAAEKLTRAHFEHFTSLARGSADSPGLQSVRTPGRASGDATQYDVEEQTNTSSTTLVYRLELQQPVIATTVEGDPNSSVSSNYLPGSALRGALIARYLQHHDESDLAAGKHARRLFFDGRTRFLNAYPVVHDENSISQVTLPTPLSYFHRKGDNDQLHDFSLSSPPTHAETQWKQEKKPFYIQGRRLHFEEPARRVTVHNQRDRQKGRATEESGALFRYDALASAQTFQAAICCDTEEDAALFKALIEVKPTLQIGGARSADYGEAQLVSIEQSKSRWHECSTNPPELRDDRRIVIVFLSHALVRDNRGQFTTNEADLVQAINHELNLERTPLQSHRAFVQSEITGGFNRKWNLPLPQALTVKMGSVLVLEIPDEVSGDLAERLATLEAKGIGERRAEGFGRVAVNRHGADWREVLLVRDPEEKIEDVPDRVSTESDPESHALAQHMAGKLLRRRLDLSLIEKAGRLAEQNFGMMYEESGEPTPSQLGRLRAAFRNALHQHRKAGRKHLCSFLNDLPSSSRNQLTQGRFTLNNHQTGTLLEWLHDRIADTHDQTKPAYIWSLLSVDRRKLPQVGKTAEAKLSDPMAYEYNLRLVNAVLARASDIHKHHQQKSA